MAKQIIILERPDVNRFSVAYWLQVPVARQAFYANAAATSHYIGISAPELSDLRAGVFVEQTQDISFLSAATIGQCQAQLVTEFAARQSAITNFNQWNRYGSFYDGASWTAGGVA